MHFKGSPDQKGMTFLFLFPFDIYHTCDLSDPFAFRLGDRRARIYPPFSNEEDDAPQTEQVKLEKVPREDDAAPVHIGGGKVKRINLTLGLEREAFPGNAVRLDVFDPDATADEAREFVERLVKLIRAFTLQWWVTRDRQADRVYLRNSFEINECGERLAGVMSHAKKYGGFYIRRLLDRPLFERAVRQASRNKTPPLSLMMLADAIYHLGTSDYRRCLIDAAMCCELFVIDDVPWLVSSDPERREPVSNRLDKMDFEEQLDDGLQQFLGSSFADDSPDAFDRLCALWTARNNVAHGKRAVVPESGGSRPLKHDDYTEMIEAVIEFFDWLQDHGGLRVRTA